MPALESAPLARYLAPLLAQPASALLRDAYLKTVLSSLVGDPARPTTVRLAAGDLKSALTLADGTRADGEPAAPLMDATVVRRAVILQETLNRYGGIAEDDVSEPRPVARAPAAPPGGAPPDVLYPLPVVVWIPHLRSPFNVGNILRTCAGFGVAGVVLGEAVPELSHPRLQRAAMGAAEMVPIIRGGRSEASHLLGRTRPGVAQPEIVALETGGTEITRFAFPLSGIMVVGHEELGTPEEILLECRHTGRVVTIPHDGPKSSLNVGVAAGICLSWWQARGATD